jgi:copper(I)-binding protein
MQNSSLLRRDKISHFKVVLAACLSLLVIACSASPPKIAIERPTGELSPMFFGVGSVFMKIGNGGGKDVLTGVTVNVPGAVTELHDVQDRRMVKITQIQIPAHGGTELLPGGPHIMIFNMPRTMRDGSEIVLTLSFARSGDQKVTVRFARPSMPSSDSP